jgi:hypothetical protein
MTVQTGRRLRPATARLAISILFALANLVFVAFAVIGWSTSRLGQIVDLVLLGGSCAVGFVLALVLATANASARQRARAVPPAGAVSAARAVPPADAFPAARRRARVALVVALLRFPAFAAAIYLVAANTTAQPDGSWRLLPGAPLLVIGFLEILATFVLAAATTSALRSALDH